MRDTLADGGDRAVFFVVILKQLGCVIDLDTAGHGLWTLP